jgi:hypothetical protein
MRRQYLLTLVFLLLGANMLLAQANIGTSLHYTREGKNTAYKAENGGMELITGIPMDDLTCKKCHSTSETYPNGDPIDAATYAPGCNDCHNFAAGTAVAEATCLNCHNRQKYERDAYPGVDVHQSAGLTCTSCHTKEEVHGDDGVAYASLKQDGAIKVQCEDCHTELTSNTSHNLHSGTVDCAACHAKSVLTCSSCHFESLLASGKNRAINQIKDYRLLVRKDNEVRLGGFMTHTYDGKTNYIISSYHSHAISKDATTCADCHFNMGGTNAAITEYNATGSITMTTWNETTKKIAGPSGVVPIPADWKTSLKFDYASYGGDPAVFPSDPAAWSYLKSETDNSHLFYAEPLDTTTMKKLGFTNIATSVNKPDGQLPSQFALMQNYPNPFNPSTTIQFSIPFMESVDLKIYDLQGRLIRTLAQQQTHSPGVFTATWDGRDDSGQQVVSGIYFVKLQAGQFAASRKMALVK